MIIVIVSDNSRTGQSTTRAPWPLRSPCGIPIAHLLLIVGEENAGVSTSQ